jgi:predicted RNA-binding protein YlxR (DUF448 family)
MPPNPTPPDDARLTDNSGEAGVSDHAGDAAPETDAGPPRSAKKGGAGGKAARDPERRCIVTMERRPQGEMIRFVLGPDNVVTPDIDGRLPGRGAWVTASREILDTAVRKGAFPRAFKSPAKADPALLGLVEGLLAKRALSQFGLARGAGQVIAGMEQVRDALKKEPVACLVEASDGAGDGRDKLTGLAAAISGSASQNGLEIAVIGCFSADELGMALGRPRVIHACLKQGPFARNWIGEVGRLAGFRPIRPPVWSSGPRGRRSEQPAGPVDTTPDPNISDLNTSDLNTAELDTPDTNTSELPTPYSNTPALKTPATDE